MMPSQSNNMSIPQAMHMAGQLQAQGKLQQSENLLKQILQQQPQHAHALHLLGVIAHQVKKTELALELTGKAIAQNDKVALFHANRGEMCRQCGHVDEAVAHGEKAVALNPAVATAHSNLGIAYFDKKEYDRAEHCQLKALELNPELTCALNNLGSIMRERRDLDAAIGYYQRASASAPHLSEPLNNLGAVLLSVNRFDEAVGVLTRALAITPRYADAHCNLGFSCSALEQYDKALQHFQTALQIRPDYPEAYIGLGNIYHQNQRFNEATQAVEKALELDPERAEAQILLATLCLENDETERATACFDKVLERFPESGNALAGKGNACMQTGDFDQAEKFFHQALAVSGESEIPARFQLTQVRKVTPGDENMAALMAAAEHLAELPKGLKIPLHFALGKCYDDTGEREKAFAHFREGCKLRRERVKYDKDWQERCFDAIIEAFSPEVIERLSSAGAGDPSEQPIFIVGMPRSGTTLTEQIIASHPDVFGAGELKDFLACFNKHLKADKTRKEGPEKIQEITPEIVATCAAEYMSTLQKIAPEARRITDKMPANFMGVGLIHLMFPKAKIVHVKRNPADICVSSYVRCFSYGLDYSYDFEELAHYYHNYERLMAHWRKVLPEGTFIDVVYEEIVADTETQARRLIDYCGLEWNAACLDFHNTKRKVCTPSATQVRQPIYSTSVERWRLYGDAFMPLVEALERRAEI